MDPNEIILGLLALLRGGEAPAVDWLAERVERDVERPDVNVHEAVEGLLRSGRVVRSGAGLRLAEGAKSEARGLGKKLVGEIFDLDLLRHADSPAYARFCERVYGSPRFVFSMSDAPQLDAMIERLALGRGQRFVDLGCGLGTLTEWIADQTGAEGLGIDLAAGAIARANERVASRPDLSFRVGDLDDFDLPPVHAMVCIDALYFCANLQSVVGRVLDALLPGGRLVAFYTASVARDGSLELAQTRLGRALAQHGAHFDGLDFSEADLGVCERSKRALDALEPDFVEEGIGRLVAVRRTEIEVMLARARAGEQRRWLVWATPAVTP